MQQSTLSINIVSGRFAMPKTIKQIIIALAEKSIAKPSATTDLTLCAILYALAIVPSL